ncbi:tetratricopeptide repeat protein [Methanobrevibacter thaueri]|uniref:Tetratricopeptide repeat protein n=1 Tax=Methanobrevibacter thaueri TaxID=190975 RepID=A0A315XLI8_9EURY|nr:tetratricopeptide repeat protein [Methanobrevibacter thaueri]PWB86899.1 tetratricopeptide repeat protein [Methanobrevibacter thaueri]
MLFKNRFDKLQKRAARAVKNREYVKAQNTYLECLALDPKDIGTVNNLAQLSHVLGEDDKARGYNEMLLEACDERLKNERTEELLILKSNALVSLKRNDEAIEVIDELLEISPDHVLGLFHKAQYLESNGEYEKSLHYINRVLANDYCNVPALLSKGRVLTELDQFERARNCYDFVFKLETKNKAAINLKSQLIKKQNGYVITSHDLMLKAIESWDREDLKSAEKYFKKALDIDSSHDEIWFAQGELFIRMGKITDAISSFEKAFELNSISGGISKKKEFFKMLKVMLKINRLLGYEKE